MAATVCVIEQTDQFQKFGKTNTKLAQKYEFKKKIKKSDLSKKSDLNFKKSDFCARQHML